jgi:DNA-directed RNA polymerase subunit RPC12/RpoP
MSHTSEGAADLELECPNCGSMPFVIAGPRLHAIHSFADYFGLSCAHCSYIISESDVEWAMKTAIYKLVKDCFKV